MALGVDAELDELLAEVEQGIKAPERPAQPAPAPAAPAVTSVGARPAKAPGGGDDTVDDLLALVNDTSLGNPAAHKPQAAVPARSPAGPAPSAASAAAAPDQLPEVPGLTYGRTNLRCTKCDFRVYAFRDRRWSPAVDYLFLRNYMPEAARVQECLEVDPDSRAYACQCTWDTVEELARPAVRHWRPGATLASDPLD
mmetsp:Transcript_13392/g.45393  ORF Transcript_13392/g.45393 Transcript_13392/m.45393 type:complete len:197 (+) Transcript_13392:98-688(+)